MAKREGKAAGLTDSSEEHREGSRCVLTPGFEGRVGSLLPFSSGPDDPGGGGLSVLRGRLPRQRLASPEGRHVSTGRAQSRASRTLAVPSPGL